MKYNKIKIEGSFNGNKNSLNDINYSNNENIGDTEIYQSFNNNVKSLNNMNNIDLEKLYNSINSIIFQYESQNNVNQNILKKLEELAKNCRKKDVDTVKQNLKGFAKEFLLAFSSSFASEYLLQLVNTLH